MLSALTSALTFLLAVKGDNATRRELLRQAFVVDDYERVVGTREGGNGVRTTRRCAVAMLTLYFC